MIVQDSSAGNEAKKGTKRTGQKKPNKKLTTYKGGIKVTPSRMGSSLSLRNNQGVGGTTKKRVAAS